MHNSKCSMFGFNPVQASSSVMPDNALVGVLFFRYVVTVRLCVVIEWVVVSCLLVEYFLCYVCLKFYVLVMSVRGSRDCHFGGCTPLRSLGPRYLFVSCFYFWLFLLLELYFLFEMPRHSCDFEGFLLLRETLISFISCSD